MKEGRCNSNAALWPIAPLSMNVLFIAGMIDVVCIDSSSDEEHQISAKPSTREKPSNKDKNKSTSKPTSKPATKSAPKKRPNLQKPKALPSVPVSGVKKLLSASDKSGAKISDKSSTSSPKADKPATAPSSEKSAATPKSEKISDSKSASTVKGSKSAAKPVGVVKATQRKVPPDTQRSINNVIKQDEVSVHSSSIKMKPRELN